MRREVGYLRDDLSEKQPMSKCLKEKEKNGVNVWGLSSKYKGLVLKKNISETLGNMND